MNKHTKPKTTGVKGKEGKVSNKIDNITLLKKRKILFVGSITYHLISEMMTEKKINKLHCKPYTLINYQGAPAFSALFQLCDRYLNLSFY